VSVYPKYKKNNWYNPETDEVYLGLDTKRRPDEGWMHCANGSEPLFFDTEEQRDQYLFNKRITR
jgi:hypothetical protein